MPISVRADFHINGQIIPICYAEYGHTICLRNISSVHHNYNIFNHSGILFICTLRDASSIKLFFSNSCWYKINQCIK